MLPIINDRKLRIAVIGCGRIAQNHFAAIREHGADLELVGLCDDNAATLEAQSREHGVPGFARIDDLVAATQPDLVALCTPSGLHPEQAIAAAARGVNVITEKPMATRWADGLRMVKACD